MRALTQRSAYSRNPFLRLCNNEVLAREGIDTSPSLYAMSRTSSGNNEVLAREGIDTNVDSNNFFQCCICNNEVLAREGIDTKCHCRLNRKI